MASASARATETDVGAEKVRSNPTTEQRVVPADHVRSTKVEQFVESLRTKA